MAERPLLILDVDETLVYASEEALPGRTAPFVVWLAEASNFRLVEKRNWRQRTS